MPEYIEREAARRAIEHADPAFCYCIDNIPAAEVAPVDRGQWEEYRTGGLFCSKCHNDAPIHRGTGKQYKANFCPYCGRNMIEGVADGTPKD